MKAVIIGSGRIGCGFAGHLLGAAGYELVFLARSAAMVEHLKRVGHYRVRLANGRDCTEHVVRGVRALETARHAGCVAELADADLIVTSVGATNLADIAPLIAAALRTRTAPVNILAFENLADGGAQLQRLVAACLPPGFALDRFGFSGTLVSRAVTQRLGDVDGNAPLVFVGDPPSTLVVDGARLVAPLPVIASMIVAPHFAAWMRRKLFIFSAGHATCAYLGFLKGYRYIHSAIRDDEIRSAVLEAMTEAQQGIAALYGDEFAGGPAHLQEIIERFANAAINDSIARVARDPQRKLSSGDRLLGAARLAWDAGVHPQQLLRAAAAAYCFSDPTDSVAAELQQEIRASGMRPTMRRVSGLQSGDRLGRTLVTCWRQLTRQWHRDSVILNLDRVQWA